MNRERFIWKLPFILRSRLKLIISRLVGIFRNTSDPRSRGSSLYSDIRKLVKEKCPVRPVVFDVGANIGQSAEQYVNFFPESRVYCFEPVDSTFDFLARRVGKCSSISLHKFALGAEEGVLLMQAVRNSSVNKIIASGPSGSAEPTQRVVVRTGDSFCQEADIDSIFLLKIDTEGHDLEVLRGFSQMLAHHRVDFIQVEAGMNPDNTVHIPLQSFSDYLAPLGYRLFGIYDQWERPGFRHLMWSNPVFVSESYLGRSSPAG